MKGLSQMKVVVIVREKGQYDDKVKMTFDSIEEARNYLKAMWGILVCDDFFIEK